MKKVLPILFLGLLLLCSCGEKKEKTDSLEFPKTDWGMTADQVFDAWEAVREDAGIYHEEGRGTTFSLENQEVFGAQASSIYFSFLNLKPNEAGDFPEYDPDQVDQEKGLCDVTVVYPEGTDMDLVLKNMRKEYGETVSELEVYPLLSPLADTSGLLNGKIPSEKYTESENVKLWSGDTVFESIPKEERESYGKLWEPYRTGLSPELWEDYSKTSAMTYVILERTEDGRMGIQFSAYNRMVYEQVKSQLSD